jgi:Transposase, Mutator family
VPQVRGAAAPFRSSLMGFLDGNSGVLDRLVTEMYARGLCTRDVGDAFRYATGELLISKSAVTEITDQLWADYQAFIARDLSDIEVEYLSPMRCSSRCAGTARRRHCWSAGASRPMAANTCCTWPSATRRVSGVGPGCSVTCSSAAWHAAAHHDHLRRRARADRRHQHGVRHEHPDQVLVPSIAASGHSSASPWSARATRSAWSR